MTPRAKGILRLQYAATGYGSLRVCAFRPNGSAIAFGVHRRLPQHESRDLADGVYRYLLLHQTLNMRRSAIRALKGSKSSSKLLHPVSRSYATVKDPLQKVHMTDKSFNQTSAHAL